MKKQSKVVLSPRKILLLALLGITQSAIFLLPYYITGAFYKPLQVALHASNAQLGFLTTIFGTITIFTVLPGGWIADKFDARKTIVSSLILTGICGLCMVFFVNYTVYCIIWGLLSLISNLLFWSVCMKAVRMVGTEDEQGKAYGYFYAFNTGSTSLISAIGVALLATAGTAIVLGLKYAIIVFSGMAFVMAVLVWKLLANSKLTSGTDIQINERPTFLEMLSVLKRKETWLISIITFCIYSLNIVATYFTPFFSDVLKLSAASAGVIYVLTGPLSWIFPPILGTISDRIGSTIKTILGVMTIMLIIFTTLLLFSHTISLMGAIIIDILATAFTGGAYALEFATFEESGMDRKIAGTCIGVASIIGYLPDTFQCTLFGSWLDKYGNGGYTRIFMYFVGCCVVALIAGGILFVMIKKDNQMKVMNAESA
jgi:nitrate/nitrite transporter NarK